jgi:hypothetical protein
MQMTPVQVLNILGFGLLWPFFYFYVANYPIGGSLALAYLWIAV